MYTVHTVCMFKYRSADRCFWCTHSRGACTCVRWFGAVCHSAGLSAKLLSCHGSQVAEEFLLKQSRRQNRAATCIARWTALVEKQRCEWKNLSAYSGTRLAKVRQLPPSSAPRLSLTYISQSPMVSRASQNVGDVCVCSSGWNSRPVRVCLRVDRGGWCLWIRVFLGFSVPRTFSLLEETRTF